MPMIQPNYRKPVFGEGQCHLKKIRATKVSSVCYNTSKEISLQSTHVLVFSCEVWYTLSPLICNVIFLSGKCSQPV